MRSSFFCLVFKVVRSDRVGEVSVRLCFQGCSVSRVGFFFYVRMFWEWFLGGLWRGKVLYFRIGFFVAVGFGLVRWFLRFFCFFRVLGVLYTAYYRGQISIFVFVYFMEYVQKKICFYIQRFRLFMVIGRGFLVVLGFERLYGGM